MRNYRNIWPQISISAQNWRKRIIPGQKLVIEIGAGVGMHPIRYSQSHTDNFMVAIERTHEKYTKFATRYAKHPKCTNLYPLHADAIKWISQNILSNEVSQYFILYPNPYPKGSQKNKRFHYMPFMHFIIDTLVPEGTITIATNEYFYYTEAKEIMTNVFSLQLKCDENITSPTTPEAPHSSRQQICDLKEEGYIAAPRTHFERKYLAQGQTCFNLVFKK